MKRMQTIKVYITSCSLIYTALIHWQLTITKLDSSKFIRVFSIVCVAEQAGLSLAWPQTPNTGFVVTWLI